MSKSLIARFLGCAFIRLEIIIVITPASFCTPPIFLVQACCAPFIKYTKEGYCPLFCCLKAIYLGDVRGFRIFSCWRSNGNNVGVSWVVSNGSHLKRSWNSCGLSEFSNGAAIYPLQKRASEWTRHLVFRSNSPFCQHCWRILRRKESDPRPRAWHRYLLRKPRNCQHHTSIDFFLPRFVRTWQKLLTRMGKQDTLTREIGGGLECSRCTWCFGVHNLEVLWIHI